MTIQEKYLKKLASKQKELDRLDDYLYTAMSYININRLEDAKHCIDLARQILNISQENLILD